MKTYCDSQHSSVGELSFDNVLYDEVSVNVNGRCSLVHNEHTRVAQEGTRETE